MTFTCLPFNWQSSSGFGILNPVLTFCRYCLVISFYIYLLLRVLKESLVFLESDSTQGYLEESEDESDVETIEKEIQELKDLGREAQDAEILESFLPDTEKPFNSHLKKAKEWYERMFGEDWVSARETAREVKERIKVLEAPVQKKHISDESLETEPFGTEPSEAKSDSPDNSPLESAADQTISGNINPCDANALEPQSVLDMAQDVLEKLL